MNLFSEAWLHEACFTVIGPLWVILNDNCVALWHSSYSIICGVQMFCLYNQAAVLPVV